MRTVRIGSKNVAQFGEDPQVAHDRSKDHQVVFTADDSLHNKPKWDYSPVIVSVLIRQYSTVAKAPAM